MAVSENTFDRGFFPEPSLAGEDGLLAAGGTLGIEVLLEAYSKGIFPWYSEGSPVLWWSPDPRMVLFPGQLKVSKSLAQFIRKAEFKVQMDTAFPEVIEQCAGLPRPGQEGTWITGEMKNAYIRLHEEGYAHSIEVFRGEKLVGGLYGVSLGGAFFGESMFHLERNASKLALYHLVEFALKRDFDLIDAQQSTDHLKSLGAKEISRKKFLLLLKQCLKKETLRGKWN
ncbi:leucyl/phenylalanyl-tRNA--protein transferase [Bacteroidota bacterium]